MGTLPPFAVIESVVVAYLRSATGDDVGTSTPGAWSSTFHRVTAASGSDDGLTDSALVDVETFAPRRLAAAEAAELVRQAMLALTARHGADALVDRVTTAMRPAWVDYQNPATHRYVASYRLELRRPQ